MTVCLPAKEVAATIGPIVRSLVLLRERGVIDSVVVVDADSADGTAAIAASEGATVLGEAELLPEFGPVLGKGDALWRVLSAIDSDVVCFVDSDSQDFDTHFVCGLLGPLLCDREIEFVKGSYRRPFTAGKTVLPEGGGRVTELLARPLLRRFYPELAELGQPLAGEFAARRELLERVPFATGYAVEIALLLDLYTEVGAAAIAQVDLEQRTNTHQPLAALGVMADAVLAAVTLRLEREGRLSSGEGESALVERPPLNSL